MANKVYDESSIVQLDLVTGIRARPSTFINGSGPDAILKLLYELIQNSNDEASIGEANYIKIIVDSIEPRFSVEDNGRGIPIGAVDKIVNNIYSGSKYDESAYDIHVGANGFGLMILKCLSEYMKMEIWRDGKYALFEWKDAIKVTEKISDYKGNKRGTRVEVKPLTSVFFGENTGFDANGPFLIPEQFEMFMNGISFCNKGVTYDVTYDKIPKVYFFNTSDKEYIHSIAKKDKIKLLWEDVCTFENKDLEKKMYGKIVCTFSKDHNHKFGYSYMNRFPTVDNGTHIDGAKSGIVRAITQYIKQNNYAPKTTKFTVTGADVIDNICIIVLAEMRDPRFDGQTKNKLTSKDMFDYMVSISYSYFLAWANNHRDEMDKLCKLAVLKAKADYAAREAKEQALNPQSVKNIVNSKLNFKNFTDCTSNNPEECELYICEGLSASSSLVLARDSKTQAYLALRGKVLNITGKKNPVLSEELQVLVSILGIRGKGETADYSKIRYNKLFIMADSDPDGSHIISLLLGFLLAYYPKYIEDGHVYIATPPFYRLNYKKGKDAYHLNILNESYFELFKKEIALKSLDLIDQKGKVLPKQVFNVYLNKIQGYKEMIESYGKELNLDIDLLELIIRCFDPLLKGKWKQFEIFGFKVQCIKKTKTYRIYYFDRNFEHYFLKIDSNFYSNIYVPMYKKLSQIYLGDVRFKNKKNDEIYGGTTYNLSCCIEKLLIGSSTTLERYKGIGELNPSVLRETAMDPKTRKCTKVTLNNNKEAIKWAGILLGRDDPIAKKKVFMK